MADQLDKVPPDANNQDEQPSNGGWYSPSAQSPKKPAGWHEPPVEEGSSRPVIVDAWYRPENAVPEEAATVEGDGDQTQKAELPQTSTEASSWYTPLEALLAGAADTVIEPYPETPAVVDEPSVSDAATQALNPAEGWVIPTAPRVETQAQLSGADTQADGWTQPTGEAGQPVEAQLPLEETQAQLFGADTQMLTPPDGSTQPISEAGQPAGTQPPVDETQPQLISTDTQALPSADGEAKSQEAPVQEIQITEDGQEGTRIIDTAAPELSAAGPKIEEPAIPVESTPHPESTPSRPIAGLTPAEAALLAEQRAREAEGASMQPEDQASQPQADPAAEQRAVQPEVPSQTAPQQPIQAVSQPTPFEEIERKVNVLRERYNAGYLTQEQLQNELRTMMHLDDDGHWWMLGLKTNRWYYFDGRDWVPAIPPGRDEPDVRGSGAPTETSVQEVVAGGIGMTQQRAQIEIDEDGMPLPARVPQEDPGATMVSPSTPFLEPVRRSEAPTVSKIREIELYDGAVIASPVGDQGLTQPSRPESQSADMTLRSEPVPGGQPTMRSDAVKVGPGGARDIPVAPAAAGVGAVGAAVPKAKPRIGEFPQPDYTEALGGARNRNTYVKWGIRFGIVAVIGGMLLTLIALMGMGGYYLYKVDQYEEAVAGLMERAATFETTQIFAANGELLAEFNDPNAGARKSVPLNEISPWLIHATVSTENETFYTDPGFSAFAIVRAAYQNVRAGETVSGASTITQQLARALVLESDFAYSLTAERKIVEVIVASEISRQYTKNQILEMYLNEFFYANFAYGAEAAAQTYFDKAASDLNPAEAAFLAGLLQSPAQYDPVINHEAAVNRMNDVMHLMAEANGTGCITIRHDDSTEWAVPNGSALCFSQQVQASGDVVYYYQTPGMEAPAELTLEIALVQSRNFEPPEFRTTHPHFVNYVWQQLEDTYGPQAIYGAGYRVYTTLDESVQTAAEQAVTENITSLQARGNDVENASVVVMRPSDGAVMGMVGSADYENDNIDGQVNVSFTGQQPGSSIKPLVYLAALQPDSNGNYWTPATVIWDVYSDFSGYVPTNYDMLYHGPNSVRDSLANSLNVPAVKTLNYVGLERWTEFAKQIGLRFPLGDPVERNAGLPTALGAVEVRLFDLVATYAMIANNGRRVDPYAILYIQDRNGNEIYRANTSPEGLQVVGAESAYLITSILSDNQARVAEFGPGWPLELTNGRIAAVKTGSTNDNRDALTVGYTPQFVVGVWVGNTDNRPMYGISGYAGAAPIWNQIMETIHSGLEVQQFTQPSGLTQVEVCNDSGTVPSQACAGRTHFEIFANSAPPPGADKDIFRTLEIDGYTGRLVNQYCQDEVEERTFVAINDPTAFNWINNTAEGNAWAQSRSIEIPVMPPPTEYCDANTPRPYVVFATPAENASVQGMIQLRGAITMPDFSRYEVRYGVSHEPEAFSQPVIVDTNQRPDGESVLGEFDTTQLDNGPYTLRLIAIDNFGRDVTRDVHITINNPEPTPEPTSLPTPTLAPTLEGSQVQPTPGPDGAPTIAVPTSAPTLTPTWTLTPTPQ